ncbi:MULTISPECIES: ArsR family transcriptional regulator [Enterococcus]|uniref:ArsR family transcriptional regulator n=1 Tax=Enterococcus TaxID=1350 RepID=UPI001164B3A6|nr:ArsR family transcriptional regulator [Enterococcus avium]HAP3021829.1 ArsR family transcriptional regulator [Enterococcus faecalis]AYQ24113.1 iron-dependent repressor [Enterococcus avium]HBI1562902.1 ArsR family transcriptional regulator [Enterococcus faecalis]HBI1566030.1 ArsR family transcriptional regulator [Enterococcus faecalis]HBI1718488.1 ArsR family transcriptional regulator [Enterococcus faecalis]
MVKIKTTTILIYLLAIQELSKRKKKLKNNDLAKILSVSPASVSEMLAKLRYEGYLDIESQLTGKAKKFIENYKKRFI